MWKTNVVYRTGQRGEAPVFVYRDSDVKSCDTNYYVLDLKQETIHVPEGSDIAPIENALPREWFDPHQKNQVFNANATNLKYDKKRVYARPNEDFERHLAELHANETITWEELNTLDGRSRVEFVCEGPSNATMLNPVTGRAPFWHPLANESPNRIFEVKVIRRLLNRT